VQTDDWGTCCFNIVFQALLIFILVMLKREAYHDPTIQIWGSFCRKNLSFSGHGHQYAHLTLQFNMPVFGCTVLIKRVVWERFRKYIYFEDRFIHFRHKRWYPKFFLLTFNWNELFSWIPIDWPKKSLPRPL